MPWPDDDIIPNSDEPTVRITALRQTGIYCPALWEGVTDESRPVYIRYKDYGLSVRLGCVGGDLDSAVFARPWFDVDDIDVVDPWTITIEQVCEITGVVVDCAVQPLT
jgi:hypothetical protein